MKRLTRRGPRPRRRLRRGGHGRCVHAGRRALRHTFARAPTSKSLKCGHCAASGRSDPLADQTNKARRVVGKELAKEPPTFTVTLTRRHAPNDVADRDGPRGGNGGRGVPAPPPSGGVPRPEPRCQKDSSRPSSTGHPTAGCPAFGSGCSSHWRAGRRGGLQRHPAAHARGVPRHAARLPLCRPGVRAYRNRGWVPGTTRAPQ